MISDPALAEVVHGTGHGSVAGRTIDYRTFDKVTAPLATSMFQDRNYASFILLDFASSLSGVAWPSLYDLVKGNLYIMKRYLACTQHASSRHTCFA